MQHKTCDLQNIATFDIATFDIAACNGQQTTDGRAQAPSKDEVTMVEEFDGEYDTLGDAEKFVLEATINPFKSGL